MRNILVAILITAFFYTIWLAGTYPQALQYVDVAFQKAEEIFAKVGGSVAAVLLHKPLTVAELKDKYNAPSEKKVRVLIVPGHEPNYGGTNFGSLYEREMNVELAGYLRDFLKTNGKYDVMVARDNNEWNPVLLNYFKTQWDEIIAYFKDNKNAALQDVSTGKTTAAPAKVQHNKAPADVALRLYGINKWEGENGIDIAIHVHFNDYPRKDTSVAGKYSGFSLYVPERQYGNSATTKVIAEAIYKRLAKYNPVSNLPNEDEGIIESPDLIAIGAHNTTNSPSVLVEYGYIYEPQFQDSTVRSRTLKDMAFQTYLGLQDFFGSGNDVSFSYDTLMLPHSLKGEISANKALPEDVLALQSALLLDGVYPGEGKSKNDCPRSGRFGPCTQNALSVFQGKYGIKGETGRVGEKTKGVLQQRYSIMPNF